MLEWTAEWQDRDLLEQYADLVDGIVVEDQLDGFTAAAVYDLTGDEHATTPTAAARALLAALA
jgi:hypothetical protein